MRASYCSKPDSYFGQHYPHGSHDACSDTGAVLTRQPSNSTSTRAFERVCTLYGRLSISALCCKECPFSHIYLGEIVGWSKVLSKEVAQCSFNLTRNDFDIYAFHDVDLMPEDDLSELYTTVPHSGPMQIARVWERYNESQNYFDGIVAFTRQQFIKINGFPNNFWGWGDEDNELYSHVVQKKLMVRAPMCDTVRDLEEINLEEKMTVLCSSKWKC
ncbi:hypothetical protein PsorP6_000025 [Peronosclerospora sorghi]|uniref:Uncharacterized protein n=1 Tax=Peronosclerospora sorghi TaxID=230839 RepID=A0ACC0WRU9_9STRA|nr:hypothetical protein PsorP6_000025 [Peronosclerospora sorghi]